MKDEMNLISFLTSIVYNLYFVFQNVDVMLKAVLAKIATRKLEFVLVRTNGLETNVKVNKQGKTWIFLIVFCET